MTKKDTECITAVLDHYWQCGRDYLPWRTRQTPYRVLVSEVMLQQTQADRVVPKYRAFLQQFPSIRSLATAPLSEVLTAWQGLGYNRRAKFLQQCAQVVRDEYGGRFPRQCSQLLQLPAVGPYTAAAICVFAYNQYVPLVETNIRTVYLHHLFPTKTAITDQVIMARLRQHNDWLKTHGTIDARTWYAALMDYGSYLKRTHGNPNNRSKTYQKQCAFEGSDRQVRGAIVRLLSEQTQTKARLRKQLPIADAGRIATQLARLVEEGLVSKQGSWYCLPA